MKPTASIVGLSLAITLGSVFTRAARAEPPAATIPPTETTAPPPPPGAPATAPPALPSLDASLSGAAKTDYDAARQLFDVGDFVGALIKFTSAHLASADPRLKWNMATCETRLHHYAKAVALLRGYLKDGGSVLSDQDRMAADQTIKAMESLTSTIHVTVDPPAAEVYIDDELVGDAPVESLLEDIGVHKVRAHKKDFEDVAQEVTVSGGAQIQVVLTLHHVVHEGRVRVRGGTKDTIAIDGQALGIGEWAGRLPSGGHTLRVTADGMLPYQTEVLVQDGQERGIDVTLNPEPRKGLLPAWAWIAGGAVVAGGLGTGAYFLFKPTSRYEGPTGTLGPGLVQ